LGLPGPHLSVSALELELASSFADRSYRLIAGRGDEAITIAAGHLRRRPGQPAGLTLELDDVETVSALTLEVEDGDDAPLRLAGAFALVPAAELLVVAPPGRYWLLSGSDDVPSPRFEIDAARSLLLALPRAAVRAGPIEDNPHFVAPRGDRPTVVLWAVLSLAVALLGWLTLRAVGEEEGATDPLNA
jgi:hypothetical protein